MLRNCGLRDARPKATPNMIANALLGGLAEVLVVLAVFTPAKS